MAEKGRKGASRREGSATAVDSVERVAQQTFFDNILSQEANRHQRRPATASKTGKPSSHPATW